MKKVIVFISLLVAGVGLQSELFAAQVRPRVLGRQQRQMRRQIESYKQRRRRELGARQEAWVRARGWQAEAMLRPEVRGRIPAAERAVRQRAEALQREGAIDEAMRDAIIAEARRMLGEQAVNVERVARRPRWYEEVMSAKRREYRMRGHRVTGWIQQATDELREEIAGELQGAMQAAMQQIDEIQNNTQVFVQALRVRIDGFRTRVAARVQQWMQDWVQNRRMNELGVFAQTTFRLIQSVNQEIDASHERGELSDRVRDLLGPLVIQRLGNISVSVTRAWERLRGYGQAVEEERQTGGIVESVARQTLQAARAEYNRVHDVAQMEFQDIEDDLQGFIQRLRALVPPARAARPGRGN